MNTKSNEIIDDFWKSSAFGGYRQAFDTVPRWFALSKDISLPMKQMVEIIVPMFNVLRYRHYELGRNYMNSRCRDIMSIMSGEEIFGYLSDKLPLQASRMILEECALQDNKPFTQLYNSLVNHDRDSFSSLINGSEIIVSPLCNAWCVEILPLQLEARNKNYSAEAGKILLTLIKTYDARVEQLETLLVSLRKSLMQSHFILENEPFSNDALKEMECQSRMTVASMFDILEFNCGKMFNEDWNDKNDWFWYFVAQCRKDNGFKREEPEIIDNIEKEQPAFRERPDGTLIRIRRKIRKPHPIFITDEDKQICGDGNNNFTLPNQSPIDASDAQKEESNPKDRIIPEVLATEKARGMFDWFIEKGYIIRREDGHYNWLKTKALCVYFSEAGNDYLNLKVEKHLHGKVQQQCSWAPFQTVFFFKNKNTGEWTDQINKFSSIIQNHGTPKGHEEIDNEFEKLKNR